MAQLFFLGTSAALPTIDRGNSVLAVSGPSDAGGLLIDCGGDVYSALLRAGLGPDALGDLFITHAHIDHIGGLPSLLESFRLGGRRAPLRILGLPEVLAIAQKIVDVFSYELTLTSWTFPVEFVPVAPGAPLILGGYHALALRMDHALPSAGVRLELPGGPLAYTSDTQPVAAIHELAQGARTLVTECTFLQRGVAGARRAKHTTALEAGQQAAASGVQRLVLVHLGVAEGWPPDEARSEAATAFSGEIITPRDGQTLEV